MSNITGQSAKEVLATEEGFYALLSQSTRDELEAKLPESVTPLLPEVLNALQALGEVADAEKSGETFTLQDFALYVSLAEDEDEDDDEDEGGE
jgi:hypothetical protein